MALRMLEEWLDESSWLLSKNAVTFWLKPMARASAASKMPMPRTGMTKIAVPDRTLTGSPRRSKNRWKVTADEHISERIAR